MSGDTVADSTRKPHLREREIRVLDILPGQYDEAIHCKTRLVNLDNNIGYETLSYVWGHGDEEKVYISGTEVVLTRNLHAALRRLRHPRHARTLWVDQLCINQHDNNEKAQQVAMMRDIYRNCTHCVIWFGEIDPAIMGFSARNAQAVFDFFVLISGLQVQLSDVASESGYEESRIQPWRLNQVPTLFANSAEGKGARRAFRAFALNGHPWWSRIWTVQEALMPTSAELQWGPVSVSWTDIGRTARYLCGDDYSTSVSDAVDDAIAQHSGLLALFLYPVRGLQRTAAGEPSLSLLMRWRYRDASDPRDKVYALLGLLPSIALPSARHYNYDIYSKQLFTDVTLDLLREGDGLRALVAASVMPRITLDLPSWAIDFACSSRLGTRQTKWWRHSDRFAHYLACGETRLPLSVVAKDMALALTGVRVDEVLDVAHVFEVDESEDIIDEDLRRSILLNAAVLELYQMHLTNPYIGGGSVKEAFWKTMVGDLITTERPTGKPHWYHQDDFDDYVQHGTRNILHDALCGMLPNHAFFVTKDGYIGVGPPHTKPKDQIWVFEGGRLPFIMREQDKPPDSYEDETLSLVGDAYVHGIMSGEVSWNDLQTIWVV
ncbi:hypothetical protein N0V90_000160 [Kalmusia sp. IMI 367209]|nr:hypothetical protein N0V90_000160 [Kalmusia sp. IMI 367209]